MPHDVSLGVCVQLFSQPSVLTPFASSHISPSCVTPSPHTVQSSRHLLPLLPAGDPGGSQVSPNTGLRIASPQDSTSTEMNSGTSAVSMSLSKSCSTQIGRAHV